MASLKVAKYKKDAIIFVVGQAAYDHFFIVKDGSARMTKELPNGKVVTDTIKRGGFLGIITALCGQAYEGTAVALTDLEVVVITRQSLQSVLQNNDVMLNKVLSLLYYLSSQYVTELVNVLFTLSTGKKYDASSLYDLAMYYLESGDMYCAAHACNLYLKNDGDAELKQKILTISADIKEKYKQRPTVENGVMKINKHECIFLDSQSCNNIYILEAGVVALTKVSNKKSLLLSVRSSGEILGEYAIFSNTRYFSAIAIDDCMIKVVNKASFMHILRSNATLASALVEGMAKEIWILIRKLKNVHISNPIMRLYDLLLAYAECEYKMSNKVCNISHTFPFDLSQALDMLALNNEDRALIFRKLKEESLLKVSDGRLIITDFNGFTNKYRLRS